MLILGAGKMGELAVQNLHGSGVKQITVMNRTFEKANELAKRFSGQAKMMSELQCALIEADILISSTGAKSFVISKDMMLDVEKLRKGRPFLMVDIAVPRDLDPALSEIDSIFLYDIDDLEGIVEANLQERKEAAEQIEIMIEREVLEFSKWLNTLGVVPVIAALREKALLIQSETMKSIERKLPNLTERERKILNKHTKSIVNQMLRDPILKVKELAALPNGEQSLELFKEIFNLDLDEELIEQTPSVQLKTHSKNVSLEM